MASTMEQSLYSTSSGRGDHHHHEPEFNLREWGLKARLSRDNTNSRRFSASHIRSFREDNTIRSSFRSNITISSTASSPGYPLREEIDPATYSFTTALKALQARSVYNSWECSSPDGFALNSKWNEAEKYICNPLSGEFPMECLSAKTLSGRWFRTNLTNKITMSAPLVYNSSHHARNIQTNNNKPSTAMQEELPIPEKKMSMEGKTRDVGTQSTPPDICSESSPSPASTPSIVDRSLNRSSESPDSNAKLKAEEEGEVKETREKEETKRPDKEERKKSRNRRMQGGCLSWMRKRHREKHKTTIAPDSLKGVRN